MQFAVSDTFRIFAGIFWGAVVPARNKWSAVVPARNKNRY